MTPSPDTKTSRIGGLMTPSTNAELEPCPFCGEAEQLYPAFHGMGEGKPYAIDCLGCGIDFVPREGMDVIAAWNRRALSSSAQRVEELEGAFRDILEWDEEPMWIKQAYRCVREIARAVLKANP